HTLRNIAGCCRKSDSLPLESIGKAGESLNRTNLLEGCYLVILSKTTRTRSSRVSCLELFRQTETVGMRLLPMENRRNSACNFGRRADKHRTLSCARSQWSTPPNLANRLFAFLSRLPVPYLSVFAKSRFPKA